MEYTKQPLSYAHQVTILINKVFALQLEQKNSTLEKMNDELQSFAYISSHDLQEPLRKIQTFADSVLDTEEENLSDKGKFYFGRMQDAAQRMQALIEDLLAYSRLNDTERNFKKTHLAEIVKQVEEDLKEVIEEKRARIIAYNLCEVNIIPFQFRQVLNNLVNNSLKFSSPERPLVINIKSETVKGSSLNNPKFTPEETYCHISVSDNGIGFEQEYNQKIFEVFQRLNIKDYKGTGIGLAIVKKIVDNHNGVISANGKLEIGATFDIYIPA